MSLTVNHLQNAIKNIVKDIEPLGDELNTLDGKLGDGDLGVTIVNGFNNINLIADSLPDDLGMALMDCAKAMTKVSGSSFGTLMGISLMAGAKKTKGSTEMNWDQLPDLLQDALDAMIARGGASLGDKTMLDSLNAIIEATRLQSEPTAILDAARTAAQSSLDEYRGKECKIGRARIFGEKTIGMDDPGMVAIKRMVDRLG